jgi:hypothetical protein
MNEAIVYRGSEFTISVTFETHTYVNDRGETVTSVAATPLVGVVAPISDPFEGMQCFLDERNGEIFAVIAGVSARGARTATESSLAVEAIQSGLICASPPVVRSPKIAGNHWWDTASRNSMEVAKRLAGADAFGGPFIPFGTLHLLVQKAWEAKFGPRPPLRNPLNPSSMAI